MQNLSPMMKQYTKIKQQYKDCILFFRLGDFYEMFFDDALLASRELEITLTGRDCGQKERAPMCGVPFHSAQGYIAKLVSRGYKVAICEQTEDPRQAKGIVERQIVKIITPGTATDNLMLDDKKNNYLCCICASDTGIGLAFCDISTGELFTTQLGTDKITDTLNQIAMYAPKEMLFNYKAEKLLKDMVIKRISTYIGTLPEKEFEFALCAQRVNEQFGQSKIAGELIYSKKDAVCAVGAVVGYLLITQKTDIANILTLIDYKTEEYMNIDLFTRRNLELTETMREGARKGSLLWVLDKTKTSMGARLLKQWLDKPLLNPVHIQKRLNGVSELIESFTARERLCELLDNIYDISRLITRVTLGSITPRDLLSLRRSISYLPEIEEMLKDFKSRILIELNTRLDTLSDIEQLLNISISDDAPAMVKDGGVIKEGYDERLDEFRKAMLEGKVWIAQIETTEREKTGIKNLKVGYNKVFGYYIEVTKSQMKLVPDTYVRRQTLANCERYITPKLKEIENLILGAEEKISRLEAHLFDQVRGKVALQIERLKITSEVIANLDVLCSFATVSQNNSYIMPEVDLSGKIDIKDGRHPVVESLLKDSLFVPNDTCLDKKDNRLAIITGPNMAGKSTYMRQVALIVLMAQIGCFVPASYASIGIVDRLFTRVGASDDLATGQSTFMVEMKEVAAITKNATQNSLIIFDEIGRGTSTYDGLAIAWAVIEYVASLKKIGAKTLFATHYHELTELEDRLDGVKNYCITVKKRGDDITFLRKIIRGGADRSYGVEVAALAGVPVEIIKRAKQILSAIDQKEINLTSNIFIKKTLEKKVEDKEQLALSALGTKEIIDELKKTDVTTYTPIEALNKLNELSNQAKRI